MRRFSPWALATPLLIAGSLLLTAGTAGAVSARKGEPDPPPPPPKKHDLRLAVRKDPPDPPMPAPKPKPKKFLPA